MTDIKFFPGIKYQTEGGWKALVNHVDEPNRCMTVNHYWEHGSPQYWPLKHDLNGIALTAGLDPEIKLPFFLHQAHLVGSTDLFAGEPWAEVAKTLGYIPANMESQARMVLRKAIEHFGWQPPIVEADPLKKAKLEIEAAQKRMGAERDKLRELEDEIADLADHCEQAFEELGFAIDHLSEVV